MDYLRRTLSRSSASSRREQQQQQQQTQAQAQQQQTQSQQQQLRRPDPLTPLEAGLQEQLTKMAARLAKEKAEIGEETRRRAEDPASEEAEVVILRRFQEHFTTWLELATDTEAAAWKRVKPKSQLQARMGRLKAAFGQTYLQVQGRELKELRKERAKAWEREQKKGRKSREEGSPRAPPGVPLLPAATVTTILAQEPRVAVFLKALERWIEDTQQEIDRLEDVPLPFVGGGGGGRWSRTRRSGVHSATATSTGDGARSLADCLRRCFSPGLGGPATGSPTTFSATPDATLPLFSTPTSNPPPLLLLVLDQLDDLLPVLVVVVAVAPRQPHLPHLLPEHAKRFLSNFSSSHNSMTKKGDKKKKKKQTTKKKKGEANNSSSKQQNTSNKNQNTGNKKKGGKKKGKSGKGGQQQQKQPQQQQNKGGGQKSGKGGQKSGKGAKKGHPKAPRAPPPPPPPANTPRSINDPVAIPLTSLAPAVQQFLQNSARRYDAIAERLATSTGTDGDALKKCQLRLMGEEWASKEQQPQKEKELKTLLLAFLELRLAVRQLDGSLRVMERQARGHRRRLGAVRGRLRRLRRKRRFPGGGGGGGGGGKTNSTSPTPTTPFSSPGGGGGGSGQSTPTSPSTSPQRRPRTSTGSGGSGSGSSGHSRKDDRLPPGIIEMVKRQKALAESLAVKVAAAAKGPTTPPGTDSSSKTSSKGSERVHLLLGWMEHQLANTVKKLELKYLSKAAAAGGSTAAAALARREEVAEAMVGAEVLPPEEEEEEVVDILALVLALTKVLEDHLFNGVVEEAPATRTPLLDLPPTSPPSAPFLHRLNRWHKLLQLLLPPPLPRLELLRCSVAGGSSGSCPSSCCSSGSCSSCSSAGSSGSFTCGSSSSWTFFSPPLFDDIKFTFFGGADGPVELSPLPPLLLLPSMKSISFFRPFLGFSKKG
ncbi:hypothetical protein TYRP_018073, partial [Tyrophagus putrescentiae]